MLKVKLSQQWAGSTFSCITSFPDGWFLEFSDSRNAWAVCTVYCTVYCTVLYSVYTVPYPVYSTHCSCIQAIMSRDCYGFFLHNLTVKNCPVQMLSNFHCRLWGWGRRVFVQNIWKKGAFCLVCIFYNKKTNVYLISFSILKLSQLTP